MKFKTIFFDFDGVIAESVDVKTEAFFEMYLPYGKKVAEKVKQHHIQNGGMSRFEKFKFYNTNFLNKKISEEEIQILAQMFSTLVLDKVINAPLVPGVLQFLEKNNEYCEYYLISGTPTEELNRIAQLRNLSQYFIECLGSPNDKTFWLERILEKKQYNTNNCLFVGDATADYQAAMNCNISFALRTTNYNRDLFTDFQGIQFYDFFELENLIGIRK